MKNFNQSMPVFIQVADEIRHDIFSGKYLPGAQIPSVRQIAYDASVNPNTVQRALALLESEGLLFTRSTAGRFVTEDEELVKKACERMKAEILKSLVSEAELHGITRGEIIKYVKEGDTV